ncbi:Alpha/beta hydrolase fold-1 [Mycena rosella]|uniref:Alpha/beta hydrolase fold-1 n=1 Tax=Mycena rosella TaxID=1033263 RepID=A0AAD7CBU6_MYCRO|nr:Alpha/beta hydrolase fold-1 [Mycena rosella]
MKRSVFTLNPRSDGPCPFHVEAVQYIPHESSDNGFTLIFLHAMNLHKETFEPMLLHLLKQATAVRIKDVWCIENPNHGRSARINHELLSTPKYHGQWTAADYSGAVHSFLTSTVHGTDFAKRKLIGVAHSAAAASLLLIQDEWPKINFHGLIFLDPAILHGGKESRSLCELFGNWAKSKRHTWDSRDAALSQLSRTAFKRWKPLGVELFVEHALRTGVDGTYVTLTCSPVQEAAFYLSPDTDLVGRPFEIFTQLAAADKLPIHLIICINDEYKGKTDEMKQLQIQHVSATTKGSVQIVEGGHMFPQTEPLLCTRAILQALEKLQSGAGTRL